MQAPFDKKANAEHHILSDLDRMINKIESCQQ